MRALISSVCLFVILAAAVFVMASESGASPPADSPQGPVSGSPLGEPPPLVAEPEEQPLRSSPEGLLRSILAGRSRVDLPYLARCESATARKVSLDKMDEARAWRHFGMRSIQPFWSKIENALDAGAARFTEEGEAATGTFDVGGSLGRIEIGFVKIDGEWFLDWGE